MAATALRLFQERGYDAVTTVDIAEAAGVNPRTFFRHFETKADAVFFESERTTNEFLAALYAAPRNLSLTDALTRVIIDQMTTDPPAADDIARYELVRRTPGLVEVVTNRQRDLEHRLVRWIAQRSRLPEDDLDVQLVAAALVACRRVVMEEGVRVGATVDEAEPLIHRALAMIRPPFEDPPPSPPSQAPSS
ncbi:MAG: TetR family transcriptional regulator [Actinomycetota bacterium]